MITASSQKLGLSKGRFRRAALSFARNCAFLLILCVFFSISSRYFLTFSNIENILTSSSVLALLALGSVFVIASGGIDLSVAAVMALSGVVTAAVYRDNPELSSWLALPICASVGTLCGVVSGILLALTRAPSFIISLGMLSVTRALAYIVSNGAPIYDLPQNVTEWGQGTVLGVPGPVAIMLLALIGSYLILHHTRLGTHILVLGDNSFAAEAMGIRIHNLRTKIFAISGALSGVAGFVFMTRTNAGDPTAGQNYELMAITAVILGGANLFGGKATIIGTVMGVLCLGVLQNGLNLLAVSSYYQVLFVGIVLISAAMLERFEDMA